jgi:hypothetical protein
MASEVIVYDNACDMRSGSFLGPHWEVHQRILNHFNISLYSLPNGNSAVGGN